jgi:hypothetical protein
MYNNIKNYEKVSVNTYRRLLLRHDRDGADIV